MFKTKSDQSPIVAGPVLRLSSFEPFRYLRILPDDFLRACPEFLVAFHVALDSCPQILALVTLGASLFNVVFKPLRYACWFNLKWAHDPRILMPRGVDGRRRYDQTSVAFNVNLELLVRLVNYKKTWVTKKIVVALLSLRAWCLRKATFLLDFFLASRTINVNGNDIRDLTS